MDAGRGKKEVQKGSINMVNYNAMAFPKESWKNRTENEQTGKVKKQQLEKIKNAKRAAVRKKRKKHHNTGKR